MRRNRSGDRGFIALFFVVGASLSLLGILAMLLASTSNLLDSVSQYQYARQTRVSTVYCRDMLAVQLLQNARFVPDITGGAFQNQMFGAGSCSLVSFSSQSCSGPSCCTLVPTLPPAECKSGFVFPDGQALYGELKTFDISGIRSVGSQVVARAKTETRLFISNDIAHTMRLIYTKEI